MTVLEAYTETAQQAFSFEGGHAAVKRCQTCKATRTLAEFAPHNASRDGRRAHCKECCLTERYRPYIEGPEQRARRARRECRPEWRRGHRRAVERYAARYPMATNATKALRRALQSGRLAKADHCQVEGCASRHAIEGHHWSYAPENWLDVLWCCAAHHRQGHAQGFIVPAAGISAHYGTIPERS
jgi:hypothetical protein